MTKPARARSARAAARQGSIEFPPAIAARAAPQRREKPWRDAPLVRREIDVARRERETVVVADNRDAGDRDRQIEGRRAIRSITQSCWKSFSPKRATSGCALDEQFRDDRGDAGEVGRPEPVLQVRHRRTCHRERRGKAFAVHGRDLGRIDEIAAARREAARKSASRLRG